MKKIIFVLLFLLLFLLIVTCFRVWAFEEFVVTDAPDAQNYPAIYEDIVVWQDYRNGNDYDIYYKSLFTGDDVRITDNSYHQYYPDIHDDYIVWQDERDGNYNIYGYQFSTDEELQITTHARMQAGPSIYGDYVAWTDDRNNTSTWYNDPYANYDVYAYNLKTGDELQITTDGFKQKNPVIYDNNIFFMDFRNRNFPEDPNYDETKEKIYGEIWVYDLYLEKESCITTMPEHFGNLAVYGNVVVWEDIRDGTSDVRLYNIATDEEFSLMSDEVFQWLPDIYENIIVWSDRRNGTWDIYGYDLITEREFPISVDPSSRKYAPAIWGNIVVWEEYNIMENSWDIHGAIIPEPSTIILLTTGLFGVVGLGLKRRR